MKKTLAALAVLGAFAGSAMAADVMLYGAVDTGFEYKHTKTMGDKAVDTFDMQTGWDTPSRWGLKGSGPFGSVAFGRFGGISSSAGTYDMLGYVESFDGGDGDVWGFASSSRYDNMVVYQTPRFAGLQLTAQYSFKTDTKAKTYSGDEGTSDAQRYASVGLSGEYGPASFAVGYELTKYGSSATSTTPAARELDKDGQLVFLGGNYDFEVVQIFAEAQYFKHQTALNTNEWGEATAFGKDALDLKGYGLHLGAAAPLVGGTLTAGLYYVDYSEEFDAEADQDFKFYGASARYNYPLSERTGVYVGAGYGQTKADDSGDKAQLTQVYCGLVHTF